MKTKIKLHGKLSKLYGEEFEFDNIKKPIDAVKALGTIFPDLRNSIIEASKTGTHYEIIVDGDSENCYSMNQIKNKSIKVIEIVPCIIGMGPVGYIIGGLILGGIAVYGGYGLALTTFFAVLGVGLIIAGIMYLLTPTPENEPRNMEMEAGIKNSSFIFNNPQNVASQGLPIPICYGKLRVGSLIIGTTISNFDLSNDLQLSNRSDSVRTNSTLKIQQSFGSSISNSYRFL
tara:strand:- start:4475 stop:5167 length:693 start_codon:yes stop_codon:yes gene_type:complete